VRSIVAASFAQSSSNMLGQPRAIVVETTMRCSPDLNRPQVDAGARQQFAARHSPRRR
jgi:hypothetical protein